ncbi:MAG: DUF58 domain-containing protein [Fimbriimonas sp.]
MRNVAGFALTWASAFIAVVAIMVNSPALFYMGTGLIATIGACRFQARLACKGLRFERVAPDSAQVGELLTVEIIVWSERKIRRPLVTITDNLPEGLITADITPSLPIAPAFDFPIRTQYQFRPLRSGHYTWEGLTVVGTDALGLVTHAMEYETDKAEMTVLPRPIATHIELPSAAGWGVSEAESGHTRGAGLEPWGVRNYVHGDSLRHVHWRSTARKGQLLVKEFEAGTHAAAAFLLQNSVGSDIGQGAQTTLELMKSHAVFLAENLLLQGARIELPGLDRNPSHGSQHERLNEIYEELAWLKADGERTLGEMASGLSGRFPPGSILFVLLSVADDSLPGAIGSLAVRGTVVSPLLYDAKLYDPTAQIRPAVDPAFVRELRAAGAAPILMKMEGLGG